MPNGARRDRGQPPPYDSTRSPLDSSDKTSWGKINANLRRGGWQVALPVPVWMAEVAQSHTPLELDRRVPQMFWYFLRRKLEQVMIVESKTFGEFLPALLFPEKSGLTWRKLVWSSF